MTTTKLTESQLQTIAAQLNAEAIALVASGSEPVDALDQVARNHGYTEDDNNGETALYSNSRGIRLNCWISVGEPNQDGERPGNTIDDLLGFDTQLDLWDKPAGG